MDNFYLESRGLYRPFIFNESVRQQFGINGAEHFELLYCLNALISRGGLVKDLLLLTDRTSNNFLKAVTDSYHEDDRGTIDVLEQLLCQIDETRNMKDLTQMFNDIKSSGTTHLYLEQQRNLNWEEQGYVRVKKVIVTPTRQIFVTSELMLGNRVLRKEGVDKFLRIVFRDEDGTRLSKTAGDSIIDKSVKSILTRGLRVVGRDYVYVGSSNSQLRDNGCYFMVGKIDDAVRVRKSMGRFKIEKVPKMMARIGQCFTQSKLSKIKLNRNDYTKIVDYMNCGSSNGRKYNFSDGVGSITYDYARAITRDLIKTKDFTGTVPSCFQFRFRGFKGVLSVNPVLDKKYEFLKKIKTKVAAYSVEFRESQQKFIGPREEFIEIVKYSSPSLVCLNKPMINIMDQVTMKQNPETHRRICEYVLLLLNRHMNRIMRALNHESDARHAVSEFPQLIPYQELARISLTQEPFFRSMLRAWAKSQLSKLLMKMKIQIAPYHGRTMFGIVDETGILQYGQVYVAYHVNHCDKFPAVTAEKIILKGPVLVTKNPAIVSGDVRIFEAVDIPSLRHLMNVIVFPQHGPRPHPDEMAGSDLDGDEYSVIWDNNLMFDYNEEPFDYTGAAKNAANGKIFEFTGNDDGPDLQSAMSDFFVEYMKQDSIGKISNSFLANSDLFGIKSQVCSNIALKHNKSVDFPKTGTAPDELTCRWNVDDDLPPERIEYYPDFMNKPFFPSYQSPRLLGECHRSVQAIQSVVEMAEFEKVEKIVIDSTLFFDGWERLVMPHTVFIRRIYHQYLMQMRALMETYGIQNEGELFCGHYIKIKGKTTDAGNNDDVSLFNMSAICQQRLEALFSTYRRKIFEHFADGMNYLESISGSYDYNNILGTICRNPTDEMKAVALKCYHLAYEAGEFISFPWLMWDVLVSMKRNLRTIEFNEDVLNEKISKIIVDVSINPPEKYKFIWEKMKSNIERNWSIIHGYIMKHVGLGKLLCYLACWSEHHKIEFDALNLCILVIKIGTGELESDLVDRLFLCKEIDLGKPTEFDTVLTHRGFGRVLIDIFGAFASNFFRKKEDMIVEFGGHRYTITASEMIALHGAAVRTYYQLSLSDSITVLPNVNVIDGEEFCSIIESYPITIKVPRGKEQECELLIKKCGIEMFGCCFIATKAKTRSFDDGVCICLVACGKMGNVMQFYDALSIIPKLDLHCHEKVLDLAQQSFNKLHLWNKQLKSIRK